MATEPTDEIVDIPAEAVRATDARDGDEIELAIAFPSILEPGSIIHLAVVGVYDEQKRAVRVPIPDELPSLFKDLVKRALYGNLRRERRRAVGQSGERAS